MIQKFIFYIFCVLFTFSPLVWYSKSFELFEFNKMIFVYLLTILIASGWLGRMIKERRLIFKRTLLDIPLLVFLTSQIISTIISIDVHTSIFGYYSRSNGGLLSIISYLLLYWALVSNLNKYQVVLLLKSALFGGLIVAIWAIPEHFGISPSCVILKDQFNADCWVQDVAARVFATLGQPNWLAAHLGILIFIGFYFYLEAKTLEQKIFTYSFIAIFYMAFIFTYSRGGTLGLLAGSFVLLFLLFKKTLRKPLGLAVLGLLVLNLIFGSAFTRFQLTKFLPEKNAVQTDVKTQAPSGGTQLENGGTESGQIRLIVWQGAWQIFRAYPIFGSGVETFAYSYYKYRPVEHNMLSEWDFLYNKAHNEYLNYLATTGIIGLTSYSAIFLTFIFVILKRKELSTFSICLLAGYVFYLIQNIFSFSTASVAVLFYLIPAIWFVMQDKTKEVIFNLPTKHSAIASASYLGVVVIGIYFLSRVYAIWISDQSFALGQKYSEAGDIASAYGHLVASHTINPGEPYYKSELGYVSSAIALGLKDTDSTTSAKFKQIALETTQQVLDKSPNNVPYYRTAILTYYQLAAIDPDLNQKTLDTIDKTINLAPTDPKLPYNKAIILGQMERNDEAIELLKKSVLLRPNYREAHLALGLFYYDKKDLGQAQASMQEVLKIVPNDAEALKYLSEWDKK